MLMQIPTIVDDRPASTDIVIKFTTVEPFQPSEQCNADEILNFFKYLNRCKVEFHNATIIEYFWGNAKEKMTVRIPESKEFSTETIQRFLKEWIRQNPKPIEAAFIIATGKSYKTIDHLSLITNIKPSNVNDCRDDDGCSSGTWVTFKYQSWSSPIISALFGRTEILNGDPLSDVNWAN